MPGITVPIDGAVVGFESGYDRPLKFELEHEPTSNVMLGEVDADVAVYVR